MGRLPGKIAVVTGVGPGNGSAIARTFAREGADLALATFATPALEETVAAIKALGRRAIVIEGDVGRRETWDRTAAAVRAEFGGVDIVVNNAATGQWANVLEVSEEQWDATLRTNLKSVYFSFQTFIPEMIERGGKLYPAAARILRRFADQRNRDPLVDALVGLERGLRIDPYTSGHDKTLRALAAGRQAAPRHLEVKPPPRCHQSRRSAQNGMSSSSFLWPSFLASCSRWPLSALAAAGS